MDFLAVLVLVTAASVALRSPLRKMPGVFYALAVVTDVAYVAGVEGVLPRAVVGPLMLLIGKCMLPLALFVVVMYIGVFAKGSKVHQWLKPVRAELSITACILACGHMAVYLGSYAPRLGSSMDANVVSALGVALALLVLLLMLGVTSFSFIKKRMSAEIWKSVQRWAYVFFGLTYVHLMLMLAPAAARGGEAALATVGIYTGVFGLYAVLRVRRAIADSRKTLQAECLPFEAEMEMVSEAMG